MGKELFHCSRVEFFREGKEGPSFLFSFLQQAEQCVTMTIKSHMREPFLQMRTTISPSYLIGTVPDVHVSLKRCVSEDCPTISRAFRGKLLPRYSASFQSQLPLVNLTNSSVVAGRKELFKVPLTPHGSIHNVHQQLPDQKYQALLSLPEFLNGLLEPLWGQQKVLYSLCFCHSSSLSKPQVLVVFQESPGPTKFESTLSTAWWLLLPPTTISGFLGYHQDSHQWLSYGLLLKLSIMAQSDSMLPHTCRSSFMAWVLFRMRHFS